MKNKRLIRPMIGLLVLLLSSLSCNIPGPLGEFLNPDDPYDLKFALAEEPEDNRQEVMSYLGRPDAFTISVISVEGVDVRMESWRYYQYATRVDFINGEAVWTAEIEPVPDGTIFAAWYDPLTFEVGMTETEASSVAASASPSGVFPESIDLSSGGEDLSGGIALVGDQIMIGLFKDQLVYVETVALFPEESEQ